MPIPDNNFGGAISNINVTGISPSVVGNTTIASVCLNISHAWDGDLTIWLRSPSGIQIRLAEALGGSGDNYTGTCFVPTGAPSITTGTPPFTGNFTPQEPFSTLNGNTVNGTWTLTVIDGVSAIAGTLLNWSITFNNGVSATGINYAWNPASGLSSTNTAVTTATPASTTTYTVTATNAANCPATASVVVNVTASPALPTASDVSRCGPGTVTLTASGANLAWWNASTGGTVLAVGSPFVTPSLSTTTTYYVSANVVVSGSLQTTFGGNLQCAATPGNGNMFSVQANASSPVTITALDVNFRAAGNNKPVKVYYKTGTYVGFETNAAAWTSLGTYTVNANAPGTATNVNITDFVIPAGQLYSIYVNYDQLHTTGGINYSNSDITILNGAAICGGEFGAPNSPRTFNGRVYYQTFTCSSNRIPVQAVINAVPASATAGSNSPLCTGQTLNLTATTVANATYSWTGPAGFSVTAQNPTIAGVTTANAGTYTVTTIVNGCSSAVSTVNVVVNSSQGLSVTPSAPTICTGGSVTLTASGGTTYTWSPPTNLILHYRCAGNCFPSNYHNLHGFRSGNGLRGSGYGGGYGGVSGLCTFGKYQHAYLPWRYVAAFHQCPIRSHLQLDRTQRLYGYRAEHFAFQRNPCGRRYLFRNGYCWWVYQRTRHCYRESDQLRIGI